MVNTFRKAIEAGEFVVTAEAIPGRGANEQMQQKMLEEALKIWDTGRVQAISITDAPGGHPALLADAFAEELIQQNITPLVHMSCKDRNRNQFESQFYAMQRNGIENLLCMTGDYPVYGWQGQPRPVFDLDSVTLVQMVQSMNKGMGYPNAKGEIERCEPSNFFPGAVVSPFKWTEGETMAQFYKLKKKVYAGAKFIISQVGFDARKMQEMLWLMQDAGINVPLIANIFILSAGTGAVMNRGAIPGCDVSNELLEVLRDERENSGDKGKEARLQRAAKMIAVAKGIGYSGVHIGGFGLNAETLTYVLDLADSYENDWEQYAKELLFAPKDAFFYYRGDPHTLLNVHEEAQRTDDRFSKEIRGNYRMSRWFHHTVFVPHKTINKMFIKRERNLEEKKGRLRRHGLEHLGKVKMYDCMDCGDCGLYATAYTCPMMHCPKCQRNGACGGSKDGWCEVYPGEQYCVWFKAYHRLKHYNEADKLDDYIVPPNDWKNFGKSPWGAMATGLDGYARRDWLPGENPDIEATDGIKPHKDAPKIF